MKKIIVSVAAVLILAGSSFSAARATSAVKTASPAQHNLIPPPGCPVDDPNGCGIFGPIR